MFFAPHYRRVEPPRATGLLDPRRYRVDDLLRQACAPGEARAWGFGEDGPRPFALVLRAEGQEVLPQDAVCRPSHVTLNGRDGETGLQVSEDKFLSADGVFVSALSLRNPGEFAVEIEVDLGYGVRTGASGEGIWAHREGPPPDDRFDRLPALARRTLVVAVAFASSPEEARARARRWAGAGNPAREQAEAYQRWFDENVPRFDCSDPWMTKLWYHHARLVQQSRRAWPDPLAATASPASGFPAIRALGMAQFENGDLDRLRPDPPDADDAFVAAWPSLVVHGLLGLRFGGENVLEMRPLLPAGGDGWSCFCLENLPCRGRLLTLVWDDPGAPGDAYDDGDKGLTVYVDGRRVRHQADLSFFALSLPGGP